MAKVMPSKEIDELEKLRQIRSAVGESDLETTLTREIMDQAKRYAARFE
jgi:hypothetical protein